MIPKLRFVFDRKKTATKCNAVTPREGLVQLEVLWHRQRKFISTGVKCYSDEWRGSAPNYIVKSLLMIEKNKILNDMMKQYTDRLIEIDGKGVEFAFELLEGEKAESVVSFWDFVSRRIEERTDIKEGTKGQHRSKLRTLMSTGCLRFMHDLTPNNIIELDDVVKQRINNRGEIIKQISVHCIHKVIRTYVKEAYQRGYIKDNPYNKVTIKRGKGAKLKFLNDNEIDALRHTPIDNISLSRVRDLAVFQMFTGLAYKDLRAFDKSKIEIIDGKGYVREWRIKNDMEYKFLILKPALDVLERYDYELPKYSLTQYNARLKLVALHCNINKELTSHMMRHTFATYALNHGAPMEIVSKILGHRDIKTTQVYAKVLSGSVIDAMSKLDEEL